MPTLSSDAMFILERMHPDRVYDARDLRGLLLQASGEHIREVMHDLWLARQVERVGPAGWRRHRSAPPHADPPASRQLEIVTPQDLFDHARFADFFK